MSILDLLVIHQLNVYQTWHWYIFVLDLDPKDPILCSRKTDKYKDKSRSTYQKKKKRTLFFVFATKPHIFFPLEQSGVLSKYISKINGYHISNKWATNSFKNKHAIKIYFIVYLTNLRPCLDWG